MTHGHDTYHTKFVEPRLSRHNHVLTRGSSPPPLTKRKMSILILQPTMATNQAPVGTLVSPRLVRMDQSSTDDLECSLHYLPKPLLREFSHVFNDEYLKFGDNSSTMEMDTTGDSSSSSSSALKLLAIPTNQKAREDLVAVGDHIEQEKDRLLNVVSIRHDRLFYLLMQND